MVGIDPYENGAMSARIKQAENNIVEIWKKLDEVQKDVAAANALREIAAAKYATEREIALWVGRGMLFTIASTLAYFATRAFEFLSGPSGPLGKH